MLALKDIKYEIVKPKEFTKELQEYPKVDCCLDYETRNKTNSSLAIEPWAEDTYPFMFSLCSVEHPEEHIKIFALPSRVYNDSTCKEAFKTFLKERRVWTFNSKFEGAVTWRWLGEFIKFDDVQCLYKTDGRYSLEKRGLSLKMGSISLLGAQNWAEEAWDTVTVLKSIVERVSHSLGKKKVPELVQALMYGDLREVYRQIAVSNVSENSITAKDAEFYKLLTQVRGEHFTPEIILKAIVDSGFNPDGICLDNVHYDVVARYCAYDSYATAMNYQKLYEECKEQYSIYRKQSWLSCVMEAYSATRDIEYEKELETAYKDASLRYMKQILSIERFASALGLTFENKIDIQRTMGESLLRTRYWNYNATGASKTGQEKIDVFYRTMFSSPTVVGAVASYHLYKFGTALEGFTEKDSEGNDISVLKRLKWNTLGEIPKQMVANVKKNTEEAINNLRAFLGSEEFYQYRSKPENYKLPFNKDNDEFQTLSQRYEKWKPLEWRLKKCIKECQTPQTLEVINKQKERRPLNTSLSEEHIEILSSALEICADMSPEADWKEMPWEMQMVFCCKTLKKLDKLLSAYINGKNGRNQLRGVSFVNDLLEIPVRKLNAPAQNLFQTGYNECSADTKRWKSFVHTIPPNSDIPSLFVPRLDKSILIHYDYSQCEVRVIAALAQEDTLLKLFFENPKADVHQLNASLVFRKSPEEVTKQERSFCKGATFSVLYGATVEAFAETYCDSNVSMAKDIFNRFYTAFPKIKKWIAERHKQVRAVGYVQTLFGDKIIIKADKRGMAEAERKAQNYPVQSSSSSLAASGIWDVWDACRQVNVKAIPQIFTHDSADWDVEIKDLLPFMLLVNEHGIENIRQHFGIPMKIDFELGATRKFMMGIKNQKIDVTKQECSFDFECAEIFYDKTIKKLEQVFEVVPEIHKEVETVDIWSSMFKPKGVYTLYKGKPIKVFEGKLNLKQKVLSTK